ncbi:hypothetical protein [Streptomyces sp. NPDC005573]|uniref:hypothetical protein n=1 Tax=Streptomyces sp. NPDC005573 TaxID=3156890 RepID=UPI0033A7778D
MVRGHQDVLFRLEADPETGDGPSHVRALPTPDRTNGPEHGLLSADPFMAVRVAEEEPRYVDFPLWTTSFDEGLVQARVLLSFGLVNGARHLALYPGTGPALSLALDAGGPAFDQHVLPDHVSRPDVVGQDVTRFVPMDRTGLESFDDTIADQRMDVDPPGEPAESRGPDTGSRASAALPSPVACLPPVLRPAGGRRTGP